MQPDDEVCLCFHVSLRKINSYLKRENPPVASLISECLGAGTGCGWCVPILEHLHTQHRACGSCSLGMTPTQYADARRVYRETAERPDILGGGSAQEKPASPDAGVD